jgi:hypothetical protein
MSTPNRAEINRSNSLHSTGPITEAGKQRSSLNALRHGLTGQTVVMPNDDLEAYERHLAAFADDYHPNGATEAQLVQALADASWRLNRVAALEANILTLAAARQPNLFTSAPSEVQEAMALAACYETQSKALANLSLHSTRLSRQFEKTVAQLRDLQKTRLSHEEHDMNHLLDIMEMYEEKGEPYDPSEDGFVFTKSQLNRAICLRNRDRSLTEAYESLEESVDD